MHHFQRFAVRHVRSLYLALGNGVDTCLYLIFESCNLLRCPVRPDKRVVAVIQVGFQHIVDIVADKTETGTNLSANVKLVDNKTINGNNWSNIIISDENGLFANVDVKYESDKLIVTVNGNITEYNLPKEKYVKGGIYDKKSESIVLTFSDDTELSIDMVDLIEEWGVEDIQKSPIMLKKEHVVFEEGVHNQSKWRDILSADVRIKDDSNNILEKVLISKEDDTYGLYVNGSASNITCMVDGEITNVQDALNNIKCDVSDNDNNIII